MKNFTPLYTAFFFLTMFTTSRVQSQQSLKSILINLGSPSCNSTLPEQELFINALTGNPILLQACDAGLPLYSSGIAYNPKDKKVYYSYFGAYNTSYMYRLDYNFTGILTCPVAGPPLYIYNYQITQFCFDKDGNNLTLYNYDNVSQAHIKRIDFATGNDIPGTDKLIDFPPGVAPNTLGAGDIVILPNGRVFTTLGDSPSRLYEIVNIDGPGHATAIYLTTPPSSCYAIAYLDGNLIVSGGCYYFVWDINSNTLGPSLPYPRGRSSIDMSHVNVGTGAAQELITGIKVNDNTADLIYQVYLKNKGNIDLNNVQLKNRLTDAFGAGNVSNVRIDFASNPAGLTLNPGYDGIKETNLLTAGQSLPNYPAGQDSLVITIHLRATNLILNHVYLSSVIVSGQLGAGAGFLSVTDSSNDGAAAKIDPDLNDVSDDVGEGIPTPFVFSTPLVANEWQFSGALQGSVANLKWHTNSSAMQAFELQRSTDGIFFQTMTTITAANNEAGNYFANDNVSHLQSLSIYYRLKLMGKNGTSSYSNIIAMKLREEKNQLLILSNPFTDQIKLKVIARQKGTMLLTIYDATGRALKTETRELRTGINEIVMERLQSLPKGLYVIKTENGTEITQSKLIK